MGQVGEQCNTDDIFMYYSRDSKQNTLIKNQD